MSWNGVRVQVEGGALAMVRRAGDQDELLDAAAGGCPSVAVVRVTSGLVI
jgi:hypothetical protein